MSARFFSSSPIEGSHATLDAAEAHHLAHVLRAAVGDEVTLFDGGGAEFAARIERIKKASVELTITERREVDRELPFALTLAVALPKGDRQRWLVEKAVELGVTTLVPLSTTRGVAEGAAAIDRLRRAVVESSKQCGRNRLMQVAAAEAWAKFATRPVGNEKVRLFAHFAEKGAVTVSLRDLCIKPRTGVIIAIGPEGGWTEAEASTAASAGWRHVDLGPRILRVETAAITLAAIVSQSI